MSAADTIRSRNENLNKTLKELLENLVFGEDFLKLDEDDMDTFFYNGLSNEVDDYGNLKLKKYKLGTGMKTVLNSLSDYEKVLMELLNPVLENNISVEDISGETLYSIKRFMSNSILIPDDDTSTGIVVSEIINRELLSIGGNYDRFIKKMKLLEKEFQKKEQKLVFEGIFVFYKSYKDGEQDKYDIVILEGNDINNVIREPEKSLMRKIGETTVSMALSTFASGYGVIPGIIAPKFAGILVSKALDTSLFKKIFSSSSPEVGITNRAVLKLYVFINEYINNLFEMNDIVSKLSKLSLDTEGGVIKNRISVELKFKANVILENIKKMYENINILKDEVLSVELDEFYKIPLLLDGAIEYYKRDEPLIKSRVYPEDVDSFPSYLETNIKSKKVSQNKKITESDIAKVRKARLEDEKELEESIPSAIRDANYILSRNRETRLQEEYLKTKDAMTDKDKVGVVLLPVRIEIPTETIVTGTGYNFRETIEGDTKSLRRLSSEVEPEKLYEYFLVQAIYSKYPGYPIDLEKMYMEMELKKVDIHSEITLFLQSLMKDEAMNKDIVNLVEIYDYVADGEERVPKIFIPVELEKYGLGNIANDGKIRIFNNEKIYLPESTEFIKLYKYDKFGRNIDGLHASDKENVKNILSEYETIGEYIGYYIKEFGPMNGGIELGNGLTASLVYNNWKILEPAYQESILKLVDEEKIDVGSLADYDIDVKSTVPMDTLMAALYDETTGMIDETKSNSVFKKVNEFVSNLLSYRNPFEWWKGDDPAVSVSQLLRDQELTPSQTMLIRDSSDSSVSEEEMEAAAAPALPAPTEMVVDTEGTVLGKRDRSEDEEVIIDIPEETAVEGSELKKRKVDLTPIEDEEVDKDETADKDETSDKDETADIADMVGGGLTVIINPITGEQHNIGSITGQNIIKNYLKELNN